MSQTTSGAPVFLTGGCVCGLMEYKVADEFEYALNCHCRSCRKATGSAFKPLGGIRRDRLLLVHGEEAKLIHGEEAADHDVHCRNCGSLLYSVVRNGQYVHVSLGTLTDEPSLSPTMHIWVSEKAGWYEICDDLPQFEGFPT